MDLWQRISDLKGQTLKTLDQHKAFDVLVITDKSVILHLHSTGKERIVERERIEAAWRALQRQGTISRSDIQAKFSPRSSAFVAALLAALPGVTYRVRPIELSYKSSD
jgi:hypothetical protein